MVLNPCCECRDHSSDSGMERASNTRYSGYFIDTTELVVGGIVLVVRWLPCRLGPGARRGVPNELMRRNNQVMAVDPMVVPEPEDTVQQFEVHGVHLTLFSPFGRDPFRERDDLVKLRKEEFHRQYPDFGHFYTVVNDDHSWFREGLLFLIDVSKRLECQL